MAFQHHIECIIMTSADQVKLCYTLRVSQPRGMGMVTGMTCVTHTCTHVGMGMHTHMGFPYPCQCLHTYEYTCIFWDGSERRCTSYSVMEFGALYFCVSLNLYLFVPAKCKSSPSNGYARFARNEHVLHELDHSWKTVL